MVDTIAELIAAATDVARRAGPDREPRLRAALAALEASPGVVDARTQQWASRLGEALLRDDFNAAKAVVQEMFAAAPKPSDAEPTDCASCKGSGEGDGDYQCRACDGTGEGQADPAPSVADPGFDRDAEWCHANPYDAASHIRAVARIVAELHRALSAARDAREQTHDRADALAGVLRRWQAWNDFHSDDRELERDTRALLSEAGK